MHVISPNIIPLLYTDEPDSAELISPRHQTPMSRITGSRLTYPGKGTESGADPDIGEPVNAAVIFPGSGVGVGFGITPSVTVIALFHIPTPPLWLFVVRKVTVYTPGIS